MQAALPAYSILYRKVQWEKKKRSYLRCMEVKMEGGSAALYRNVQSGKLYYLT